MNRKVVTALILLVVVPVVICGTIIAVIISLHSESLNRQTHKEAIPPAGDKFPVGLIYINLNFTKSSLQDNTYALTMDTNVATNETTGVTFAFYNPESKVYNAFFSSNNMSLTNQTLSYGLGFLNDNKSQMAVYPYRIETPTLQSTLERYDPSAFPYDTYQTPRIAILLSTYSSESTGYFGLGHINLTAQAPSGFVVTSSFKELSKSDVGPNLWGNSTNTYAIEFQITMLRNGESLVWLSIYIGVPLLGLWTIFAISEVSFTLKGRMDLYAGALLATFAYLFVIRSLTPTSLTLIEVLIIGILGLWAVIDLARTFHQILLKNTRLRYNYDSSPHYFSFLKKQIGAFGPALWASFFFGAICFLLYIGSIELPLLGVLMASGRTPWGIVTSLFMHSGAEHLVANTEGLVLFLVLFLATNLFLSDKGKHERSVFLLKVAFFMAIMANIIWVVLLPETPTAGSSGVVYALEGIVLGFCLINCIGFKDLSKVSDKKRRCMLAGIYLFNLIVFLVYFVQLLVQPREFLSAGLFVNVFVHGAAFLGGFLAAVIWVLPKLSVMNKQSIS